MSGSLFKDIVAVVSSTSSSSTSICLADFTSVNFFKMILPGVFHFAICGYESLAQRTWQFLQDVYRETVVCLLLT